MSGIAQLLADARVRAEEALVAFEEATHTPGIVPAASGSLECLCDDSLSDALATDSSTEPMEYEPKEMMNLSALSSFNAWGVPFGSDLVFERPPLWREFNDVCLVEMVNRSVANFCSENAVCFTQMGDRVFQKQLNHFLCFEKCEPLATGSSEVPVEAVSGEDVDSGERKEEVYHSDSDEDSAAESHKHKVDTSALVEETKDEWWRQWLLPVPRKGPYLGSLKPPECYRRRAADASSFKRTHFNCDLIVSTFQELWSFRKSFVTPAAAQSMSKAGERMALLGSAAKTLVSSLVPVGSSELWDAPSQVLSSESAKLRLPFTVAFGSGGLTMSRRAFTDAGLAILSNWKPDASGFVAFKKQTKRKPHSYKMHEEQFANKGFLWTYFCRRKTHSRLSVGTVVCTVHLTTKRKNKLKQILQLVAEINALKLRFAAANDVLELFLTGDFNLDFYDTNGALAVLMKELSLTRVSCGLPTTVSQRRSLDHIFRWVAPNPSSPRFSEVRRALGSLTVLNAAPVQTWLGTGKKCGATLSDHCWQSVHVVERKKVFETRVS